MLLSRAYLIAGLACLIFGGCSDANNLPKDADAGLDHTIAADVRQDVTVDDAAADQLSDLRQDGASTDGPLTDGPLVDAQVDTRMDMDTDSGGTIKQARVLSFNLHCFKDQPTVRAEGIAKQIAKLKVDVVGLQEVCESLSDTSDNFAKQIATLLKTETGVEWEFRFAKTHVGWGKYNEGLGLLARKGQLVDSGEQSLPQGKGAFPRKVIWGRVKTAQGSLFLYSTHLTISSDWRDRANQSSAIVQLVKTHQASHPGIPHVVVGDFNDKPWTGPIQAMTNGPPSFVDTWAQKHPSKDGYTISVTNPHARIDYIFVDRDSLKAINSLEIALDQQYKGVWMSDHLGLFADLSFQ